MFSAGCIIVAGVKTPRTVAQRERLSECESEHLQSTQAVQNEHSLKSALRVVVQVFSTKDWWCMVTGNLTAWFRLQIITNFLAIYTEILIPDHILPPGSFRIATFFALSTISGPVSIFIEAINYIFMCTFHQ